ncbi:RNA 3'-terminal phosphate cyclase/enolpyruvate transferase [Neohortaea acidophila]|uniref:RNA 3'-terminal phosphate cyclase/enolpyruvate transferase n=1 Tax=Neohortaea acidophila TaxID=245834 RepID=A0A6A6Q055_9PEZI|nr:RNA 3'-terminal phosphate cyclase/enolpyruvate transferase [Neohortaea acidophila]KAF2485359.1 RNA 3'-terminal phosphate cyclase/enolpyruvate transferase [Neohortaea acidophila]
MAADATAPLKFTGSKFLVQRLVLATLTGKAVRISHIRAASHRSPGLAPHEVSILRLLESLTNGSQIEFSYTGTTVLYKPGLITGSAAGHGASGGVIRHELPADCTRGASYFIIPVCLLAPFSKAQVNVLFTGPGVITSATETGDVSVDTVRTAILPLFKSFGIELNIELRILKRSNPGRDGKGGGGEVQLVFGHQVRLPKTIHLLHAGRVKRIRGVAYSTGVAGANNARLIEAARGVLNELVPDVYIYSDVSSAPFVPTQDKTNPRAKRKTGLGFGLSLVAETTTNTLYSADTASPPSGGETPEDLGKKCAYQLLEAIETGGCISHVSAFPMLSLMAMGSEDVGRITVGKEVLGSEPVIQLARDLRMFGMSGWGMREEEDGDEDGVVVSVVGRGVGNVGRKIA